MNNFIKFFRYVFYSSPLITALFYALLLFAILFASIVCVWIYRRIMKLAGKDKTYNYRQYSTHVFNEISPCIGSDNKIQYRPIIFTRDTIARIITKGIAAIAILAYTILWMAALQYIGKVSNNGIIANAAVSMLGGILGSTITIAIFLWTCYKIRSLISEHKNADRAKIRIRRIIGRRKHD